MKKIVFLLCATAMLGLTTSCHQSTDVVPNVSPVVIDESRTLMVTTNTPADITYQGKTVRNVTRAVFENTAAQGKLKITPTSDQYYDQDEMAVDFYDQLTLSINVELVKKPSILVSQEDAKEGTTVTNDADNQESTGTVATINVSPNTVITGSSDPFSITTFVPAETVLESTEVEQELAANVLVIRCNPDNTTFSEPVSVNLGIENSTGFDIECVSEDGSETLPMTDLGNDRWQVSIPHFSDWHNVLKATIIEISEGSDVTTGTTPIVTGNNKLRFQQKFGALETSEMRCILVTTFIGKKFGDYFETEKNATFTSDAPGFATWRIIHPYKDVTLISNIKRFKARVFGNPTVEIINTQSEQGGHSGGSIN